MKRTKALGLLCTLLIVFFSCKKEFSMLSKKKPLSDEQIINMVEGFGEKHNIAMENIKKKLIALNAHNTANTPIANIRFVPTISKDTLVEIFLKTNASDLYGYYGFQDSLYFDFEDTYTFLRENIYGQYFNERENAGYTTPLEKTEISEQFVSSKNKIKEIILNSSKSDITKNELELIRESLVASVESEAEKIAIAGMIEIGIASSEYWSTNLNEWNEVIGYDNGRLNTKPTDWKEVAWADAVGAVVGAIKGAIKGTVFGAAYGAACGGLWGMLSGAVGASAGDWLTQKVKSFINW